MDQDTPPLTPRVLAGILGMDALLHRPKLAEKALLRYNSVKSSTAYLILPVLVVYSQ